MRRWGISSFAHKVLQKPIKANKSFVDDSKVSDHHAIIPTEGYVNFSAFTDKERKIYDLVVKRFLAVLFPAFEYEQLTLRTKLAMKRSLHAEKQFYMPAGKYTKIALKMMM